MSTKDYAPSASSIEHKHRDMRVAIVYTLWNRHITEPLRDGAIAVFDDYGVAYETFQVPGAVELTYAASRLSENSKYDAIVVLGCVIRGGTPHFDYVCQSVTQGVTSLNSQAITPVIFGLLTVDNEQQALDRIGGPAGHKGREAAEAAILMFDFDEQANI